MKIYCLLFVLVSCAEKQVVETPKYFDIKGLFAKQIVELSAEKPNFTKSVELNSESETKQLSAINWEKELEPFLAADLNKPAFTQSYDVVETDSTLRYLLKIGEKKPISSIWMMKKRHKNQITFIEIASNDENLLYNWNKTLFATFEGNKLKKYSVKGSQKILIFAEEKFHIIGQRK